VTPALFFIVAASAVILPSIKAKRAAPVAAAILRLNIVFPLVVTDIFSSERKCFITDHAAI
jgi:hypothetical protein